VAEGDISRVFGRAVQAMVQTALPNDADVYYGKVTKPDTALTYPYVVIWLIPATGVRGNLTGSIISPDSRLQLTGVGRDVDEVVTVLDRAGSALRGQRPTIPGYRCGLIWEMAVHQPVTKNEDLWWQGQPTYRSWSMFRLSSEVAAVEGS
jgi:hypothetical protein